MSTAGLPSSSTTNPTRRPGTTLVMNNFSPVTSKKSPAGTAVVRSAVRSEPAHGSVRANADIFLPLASGGSSRVFCSLLPNVRSGSTAPMQPCTDASAAVIESSVAIRVKNRAKRANGAPWPPNLGSMSMPQ